MGWRERHGGGDERAAIAARARALLDTAGSRPSPGVTTSGVAGSGVERGGGPTPTPFPPPHVDLPTAHDPDPLDRDPLEPDLDGSGPTPRRGGWVPTTSALLAAGLPREVPGLADRHDVDPPYGTGPGRWAEADEEPARPGWRERVRWDPGRRGLVAVAAVVVVVGSVAGGAVLRTGSSSAVTVAAASGAAPADVSAAPVTGESSGSPAASGDASPTGPASPVGEVTVDVAGLVVRPGVYTLPAGSRVEDALAAAGGPQPGADLTGLNRARVLVDGEQLAVGIPGAAPVAPSTGGAATGGASGPTGLVDLNTAGTAELDTLPGVGPVLAQAIVTWRTDHGRFASVDDLQQVTGIGPSRFADLKALVTV